MCEYSQSKHTLSHCKYVLIFCAECPNINITNQETDDKHLNTSPSFCFHIFHLIARCTKHGRFPLTNKKSCCECQQDTASRQPTKICTTKHTLSHCKYVLIFCAECPNINITNQETDDKHLNTSPSFCFHIFHLIARCTKHGRFPLTNKKSCCECQQDTASRQPTKICTTKELVMTETTIYDFYSSFFSP